MTASATTPSKKPRARPAESTTRTAFSLSWGGAHFACFCAEYIVQTIGRWANKPLHLEPWQLRMESEMLQTDNGIWFDLTRRDLAECSENPARFYERLRLELVKYRDEPRGHRRYREAYVQISKKTGKSTLSASHGIYLLGFDGEMGAEVYSCATAKDQARIVFGQARKTVLASPKLQDFVKVYRDTLAVEATSSVYRVISADAGVQEGLNPHGTVIDELHRHKSRDLYDVMTSGEIARERPLTLNISNAGTDLDTICGELYEQARAVITKQKGARQDLYAYVPELTDVEVDNVISAGVRALRRGAQKPPAEFRIAKKVNEASWVTPEALWRNFRRFPPFVFKRRHLNMWTGAEDLWLPPTAWDECYEPDIRIEPGDDVIATIDMGRSHDTAGVLRLCKKEDRIVVEAHSWGVHLDPEKPPPAAHKLIEDSDRVSFGLVEEHVRWIGRTYTLDQAGFDPWRFDKSAEDLEDEGLVMVKMPQTNDRMCPASQDAFNAVTDRVIAHNGDQVLKAHIHAGVAKEVDRGWRLTKKEAKRPCDLAICLVMGLYLIGEKAPGPPGFSSLN